MIDLMRDEIIERLDELYYGPHYPYIPELYERRKPHGKDPSIYFER